MGAMYANLDLYRAWEKKLGQGKGKEAILDVHVILTSENRVLTVHIDQVEHPEQFSCVET